MRFTGIAVSKEISTILSLVALAIACLLPTPIFADDLLGADKVLAHIDQASGVEKKSEPAKGEAELFMRDLESFRADRAKLSIDVAVERWLKLYERFKLLPPEALKGNIRNRYIPVDAKTPSLTALIFSIPPPSTWDVLENRLSSIPPSGNAARDTVLRALMAYLTQNKSNLDKGLVELKAVLTMAGNQRGSSSLTNLQMPSVGKGGVQTIESFETYLQSLRGERPEGKIKVLVPDLVEMAGDSKAEEVLLKAISIPGVSLRVPSGGKTLDLAKRLAAEHADLLTEPQWELVTGLNDTALYEAMSSRFPEKKTQDKSGQEIFQEVERTNRYRETDANRNIAKVIYLLALIGNNRIDDAVALSKRMDFEEFQSSEFNRRWHSFDKYRYTKGLNQWCFSVLADRPELPLWKQCGLIAVDKDEAAKLTSILDSAVEKSGLSLESRLAVHSRKVELLLAMDRTDDAVELLRSLVNADDTRETPQTRLAVANVKLRMTPKLIALGRLLSRAELVTEGETLIMGLLAGNSVQVGMTDTAGWESRQALEELVDGYIDSNQLAQAEKVVIAVILSTLNSPELSSTSITRDFALAGGIVAGQLTRLAQIYDKAGRFDDVLTLMEKARWWGATDLIDINDTATSLAPIAARALHKSGRDSEAIELLKWHLYANPGDDAAYRTLTDMLGPSIIPWLDRLQTRDRFEERPLIWKAVILKKEGRLDDAEAAVREAVKIDPTDGEEPPGDRVRAYAVLAEILKAKGRLDDAAFFDRVVQSVRLAEQGDKLTDAGLLRRSLAVYEQASGLFADAYCVQWRLAERLSSIGDLEAARIHYEIAFERMPEQFGQVAHFCFGCEGVFTHQQSVSVAEDVLNRIAKISPNKPQVHYLLGQLREAQGRKGDAYSHFRKAAELDPRYLDAWKSVYELRNDVFLTQKEMDDIALRMVRLDPLTRHSGLDLGEITDVKGLWAIYQDMAAERLAPQKRLYPLNASKQELEELIKKIGGGTELFEMKRAMTLNMKDVPEPGDAVVKNHFVQRLLHAAGE